MKKWFVLTVLMLSYAAFSPPVVMGRDVGHYEMVMKTVNTQVTGEALANYILSDEISVRQADRQKQVAILQPVNKTVSVTATFGHAIPRLLGILNLYNKKDPAFVPVVKYNLHIDPGLEVC